MDCTECGRDFEDGEIVVQMSVIEIERYEDEPTMWSSKTISPYLGGMVCMDCMDRY